MEKQFEVLRENLKRETRKIGHKAMVERTGISKTVLSLLLSGERPFKQDHLERISKALGIPLSQLLLSPSESELRLKEMDLLREVRECLELMLEIPEIKRGVFAKLDDLKVIYKDKVDAIKKKEAAPHFVGLKGEQ